MRMPGEGAEHRIEVMHGMPDLVDRERLRLLQASRRIERFFLEEESDLVAGFLEIGSARVRSRCGGEDRRMRRGVERLDQSFGARLQVVAEDNRHEVLDDEIAVLG